MKSIRRTLILNVTLLLLLALGTVAALVYRITENAIQAKQQVVRHQVEAQFAEQRDHAMLEQARTIASDAQSQFNFRKFEQYLEASWLTAYTLPLGPNAHIAAPIWLEEHLRGALSLQLSMLLATDIKLHDSEAIAHGVVQVNSDWGNIWRSKSLSGSTLPVDASQFSPDERFQWLFDDVELAPGVKARRVRLKAPLIRARVLAQAPESAPERAGLGIAARWWRDPFRSDRMMGPQWNHEPRPPFKKMRPSDDSSRSRPSSPPSRPATAPPPALPTVYVQVAWDPSVSEIHDLAERRDQQLGEVDAENQRAMAELRNRLTWIGAGTLAIVVIGGWLLVGVGLAPLKRLSLAVSQVSAKDFKLPIEPRELPGEVSPVAERLQQTLTQLREAFAREKRASADISHELRTPLAAMATTLEVALRKPRSAEEYRQTIEDARQINRQISQLVDRMLKLAWLDAGGDQVHAQAVDIDDLVVNCAAIGRPLAEANGLKFQVNAERPLTVRTDPDKVREVVMNLLHNAIEYNRPGGAVELHARAGVSGVVLEVRDTGIGIPLEAQEKIFERFYRGDPSRNAAGVHAGLGLAIVKEYVDRLGGRLTIESQVGNGSRFRIELPNV